MGRINQTERDMKPTVGSEIFVALVESHLVCEGAERALVTHVGDTSDAFSGSDGKAHSLCHIEWVDRPLRHQRNGSFRPSTQVWVPHTIS